MKYYLISTGVVFALILLAHLARFYQEGNSLLREPVFLFTTCLSIAFSFWAILLLRSCLRNKDSAYETHETDEKKNNFS